MAQPEEPFRWFGKVPKSWLPFQIAIVGAWAVIITVFISTCGESSSEREARLAAEAATEATYAAEAKARDAEYEEREAAEKVEVEKKRVEIHARICTPEMDAAAGTVLVRTVAPLRALVDQDEWDTMSLDERAGFAMWAAVCELNDTVVLILHGRTGEQIAHFSVRGGYHSDE